MLIDENNVVDSFLGISASLQGALGTLILGFLAIYGEKIRNYLSKPKLINSDSPIKTKQITPFIKSDGRTYNEAFTFYRLPVKNIGLSTAKEVRVLLTYTKTVEDFIPIPLNWTHWNKSTRNISVGEPAYVDILRRREDTEDLKFCWSVEAGTPVEPTLSDFNPQNGNLRLEFYESSKKVGDIQLRYFTDKDLLEVVS